MNRGTGVRGATAEAMPARISTRAWVAAWLATWVAAFSLVSPAGGAAHAGGWDGTTALGGPGGEPRVVITGGGGAAAVWSTQRRGRYIIEGAVRVDGKWKWTQALGVEAFEPSLAALGKGDSIAVWEGSRGVEGAWSSASGGWSQLLPIRHTAGAFGVEVVADGEDRATAVWRQPGPGHYAIDVATCEPGGEWSAPRPLSRPGGIAFAPQIAVAPSGVAVATWRREAGRKSIVQAATRDRAGRWSRPKNLSAPGENAIAPQVAIGPSGEEIAVWVRSDGAHQIVQASVRPPAGRWSKPVDLSEGGRDAEEPRVAMGRFGEAVVVWERFDGLVDRIQARTRTPGGRWSRLQSLSDPHRSSHEPELSIDAAGTTWAVWMHSGRYGASVEESSRPVGGRWSGPRRIAEGPTWRREATVAASGDGEAVAIWAGQTVGAIFHPSLSADP